MGMVRELERVQRLLRRLDLEEVLEDLGLEVLYRNGSDAYLECPDPEHQDANPSFHVCVEDVRDDEGRELLGAFSCWSHPGEPLRSRNFLDLVARVRGEIWGEDRWVGDRERDAAGAWLRREFVRVDGEVPSDEEARLLAVRRRASARTREEGSPLLWPPSVPLDRARGEFRDYLSRRGIGPERARELGVLAVNSPGEELRRSLSATVPGVLFPIRDRGEVVNWFLRSIFRVPSKEKGRYCPRVPLTRAGVLWNPDVLDPVRPVAVVEGIFDAERVRSVLLANPGASPVPPQNVVAILGGRVTAEQARRLRSARLVLHLADGDAGGRTAFDSLRGELRRFVRLEFRPMPPSLDPGDAPEALVLAALRAPAGEEERVSLRFRSGLARR